MARFTNLHDVGTALCDILQNRIDPALEILPAPPLENPAAAPESVRVTLLWVTPQPTHRNDPFEAGFDGTLEPAPLTLSGFYLVTTYGTDNQEVPVQAYNRLGQVLRVLANESFLNLPQPPVTNLGEGALGVVLIPMAADLMEKIYTPLQMRHRPWALFEVAPIQLLSLAPTEPSQYIVHPGGVHLADAQVAPPPIIDSITPARISQGGQIRLNALYSGTLENVRIGDTVIPPAALIVPTVGGPVLASLPPALTGTFDVSLRVDGVDSEPQTLQITDATVPSINALDILTHSMGVDLVISGQELIGSLEAVLWPESGIASPADVITLPLTGITPTQVTLTAASFAAASVQPGHYRISVRIAPQVFSPYIQVEVLP